MRTLRADATSDPKAACGTYNASTSSIKATMSRGIGSWELKEPSAKARSASFIFSFIKRQARASFDLRQALARQNVNLNEQRSITPMARVVQTSSVHT
jgi:hypothetical protein